MTTILLMGPTAAGKSALALDLAQAFGGEIVSVDSAQVYRGMDVGTAKPDRPTRERVAAPPARHRRPYRALFRRALRRRRQRRDRCHPRARRVPIVAGGTMLYFKALTEACPICPARTRRSARRSIAMPRRAAGRRCTRSSPGSIRRRRPASRPATRSASSARSRSTVPTGVPLSAQQGRRVALPLADALPLALMPWDRRVFTQRSRSDSTRCSRGSRRRAGGAATPLRPSAELPAMRAVGYRQAWCYLEGAIDRAASARRASPRRGSSPSAR